MVNFMMGINNMKKNDIKAFYNLQGKIEKILTNYNWHTEASLFSCIFDDIENMKIPTKAKIKFVNICLKNINDIFK